MQQVTASPSSTAHAAPRVAAVLLTQGTRPDALVAAIASIHRQHGVRPHVILVTQGMSDVPDHFAGADEIVRLPTNVGIPEGRNIGIAAARTDVVLVLDDDATLLDDDVLARGLQLFAADPRLAVVALRLTDERGRTQRRHVPRIGGGSATRSGQVTAFVGAANLVRVEAFMASGRFDQRFFYSMEETDLAWRLVDDGWRLWYDASLRAFHPATQPSRHPHYAFRLARNRFWMAYRGLPVAVAALHLGVWTAIAALRGEPMHDVLAGYRAAWRERPQRAPMRWRTVWRLTCLGRPPAI